MKGDQLYKSLNRTDYLSVTDFSETFQVGSVQVNIEYNINKYAPSEIALYHLRNYQSQRRIAREKYIRFCARFLF